MVRYYSYIIPVLLGFMGGLKGQKECDVKILAFNNGEKLTYEVFYHWGLIWANAGESSFTANREQYKNKSVFHFVGEGHTYKSYDWFYKVRDKFDSWVDTNTLKPHRHIRNTSEGSTKTYNDNYFTGNKATCFKLDKGVVKKDSLKINDCTFDVLTMIYFARCIDYSKYKDGDKIPISLYLDGELHDTLYIRFLGRQKLKTALGEKTCILFSPLLIKGTIFSGGEGMKVWVIDDDKKIPVLIKTPIVVGEILVKYKPEKDKKN